MKSLCNIHATVSFMFLAMIVASPASVRAQAPACHAPAPVAQALLPGIHVPDCYPLDPLPYPPTTGRHYQVWANFQIYDSTVSPGYWLHSAEHGAIVFLYNCLQGCPDEVAALKAFIAGLPEDTACTDYPTYKLKRRIVMAPDPHLDSAFAAVAWGWSLQANCLDTAALRGFHAAHYGKGPEDFCYPGLDFSGSRGCGTIAVRPRSLEGSAGQSGPGGESLLWEGSLAERVDLTLEISSLDGARLETVGLGKAGPGPARASWHPDTYRAAHAEAGALVVRVLSSGKSGRAGVLAERIIRP